ncbi:PD40 domain-containing protein [Bacteroides heparinolyticus]|uniref:Putative cytochrome c binding protein n=2 Tax=Prevotella heparinolytica TaxID=28113 RepID=A0A449I4U1_9BACE|nr:PD40 domain-containing protein [Bacteroides heparinolyticus]VFB14436.1 putative cytochrome c binding protein [Bacteroides heparinolyticus]
MRRVIAYITTILWFAACSNPVTNPEKVDAWPVIYPDYIGVTIPATIAPMNFDCIGGEHERVDVTVAGGKSGRIHINGKKVSFSQDEWRALLEANKGDSLLFTVCIRQGGIWRQYRPFPMYVSPYPIDYGVVYRKLAPGYEVYSKMGIYERNLSSFDERPLLENTMVTGMCLNCHAFNKTNPDYLSLHIRGKNGGTLMRIDGRREMLNTKTDSTLSACVYPYWHPGGKYIAYSVNNTRQSFHTVKEERVEVLDLASDVLVYHPETHELLRSPLLQKKEVFETFPVFSSDGRKLYFCAAEARQIPAEYKEIRYNLCSIGFNPEDGTFGERVDTLVNAAAMKKSISFPRPSYDGKYIMFTLSDYGNFSIWHKEADLWLLDVQDGAVRPIREVNSNDTESFHNWSSNSRWFVFSSRRGDGLYTRLYLASMDENGMISKPFLLPQKNPWEYYDRLAYSYNVPDFTCEPVKLERRKVEREIVSAKRVPVRVRH